MQDEASRSAMGEGPWDGQSGVFRYIYGANVIEHWVIGCRMGLSRQELAATLAELAALLEQVGETHWAGWIRDCESRLIANQFSGVERLLGAYGGMGSFNDLRIMQANGHKISESREDEVNERLAALRSRAYTHASSLKRGIEWSFDYRERSAGVWVVTGRHADGRGVERTGTELDEVLEACRRDAKAMDARQDPR